MAHFIKTFKQNLFISNNNTTKSFNITVSKIKQFKNKILTFFYIQMGRNFIEIISM